jgi:hypothetical protein
MNKLKVAAALLVLTLSAPPAGFAKTVFIPPGSQRPPFGGEILLTAPGPVAGYWQSQCNTWRTRSRSRRGGPRASPELMAAIDRFVSGLISKMPNYDDMSPAMAAEVRRTLDAVWPSVNRMGRASNAQRFDKDEAGNALYVVNQRGGRTHWNITVDPNGKIAGAFICQGQGL